MKQFVILGLMLCTGLHVATAQHAKPLGIADLVIGDEEKKDSAYRYWNNYVEQYPQDEQGWRNLFDTYAVMTNFKIEKGGYPALKAFQREANIVSRMQQAIPDTYTFWYAVSQDDYWRKQNGYDGEKFRQIIKNAVRLLPQKAQQRDYETLIIGARSLGYAEETKTLLSRYYTSNEIPKTRILYDYNELQGIDEGGIYIAKSTWDLIGKLILQQVLGLHKDKIIYWLVDCHNMLLSNQLLASTGIPRPPYEQWDKERKPQLPEMFRWICEHSKRPVFFSAQSMVMELWIADDMKEHIYNEGLTMRYSAKPYNNLANKRRNVEERYRMDYMLYPIELTQDRTPYLSLNYYLLLRDLLPYYKRHDKIEFRRLVNLFQVILDSQEGDGISIGETVIHYEDLKKELQNAL